jgi:hypothetical protein
LRVNKPFCKKVCKSGFAKSIFIDYVDSDVKICFTRIYRPFNIFCVDKIGIVGDRVFHSCTQDYGLFLHSPVFHSIPESFFKLKEFVWPKLYKNITSNIVRWSFPFVCYSALYKRLSSECFINVRPKKGNICPQIFFHSPYISVCNLLAQSLRFNESFFGNYIRQRISYMISYSSRIIYAAVFCNGFVGNFSGIRTRSDSDNAADGNKPILKANFFNTHYKPSELAADIVAVIFMAFAFSQIEEFRRNKLGK